MPAGKAQQLADTLREVNVKGRKNEPVNDARIKDFAPGQQVITIDSNSMLLYRQQAVADLLSRQVPVFIKSYGFNSLATLSFRGSSAAQSQVLWEGVPLQNAALGIADVSLLPVSLVDKINVVYGSSSALLGSGNVGGALLLEQDAPSFTGKKYIRASVGAGSFGQWQGGAGLGFSTKKWYVSARLFGQAAQNNFRYTDGSGAEKTTENARLSGGGALVKAAYKINALNTVSVSGWYQQYDRRIPAALFESVSAKEQEDASLRLLAEWQRKTATTRWYVKTAFIRDGMRYMDSLANLRTNNRAYQSYSEAGVQHTFGRHYEWLAYAPVHISWMNNSVANRSQEKLAVATALRARYLNDRLQAALALRGELINGTGIFLSGLNASYQLTRWLKLRANLQRTYRAPNLNELYYVPGGNDQLRPERGWNEDAGYALQLPVGKQLFFTQDMAVYNRQLHDWIVWFGGAIWTPHNIAVVRSRGAETENRLVFHTGSWQFHLGLNAAYAMATTISSYIPGDNSYGRQIPYTPRYQWQANAGFSYKGLYVNYNHCYTGYRYITTDESAWLAPYETGNVQLMYRNQWQQAKWYATLQCNNIWDRRYEVVSGRVMPGVNWLAALGIEL
jgi:iron complex outermembrane receptor protein